MVEITNREILNAASEWERIRKQKREVLQQLLNDELAEANSILVELASMAGKQSFVGVADFQWINANVRLAWNMPFFKYRRDDILDKDGEVIKRGKLVADAETLNDMRQREPDYTRELPLVRYLLGNRQRKFPPLTVVVVEKWVYDLDDPMWGDDGQAQATSMPVTALDSKGRVGLLNVEDVYLYALDGQHRVLGIAALFELIKFRKIALKDKHGNARKIEYTLEQMMEEFGLTEPELDALALESMGVEFLPAVIKGETFAEARERIANVFVNVNKSAVQTTPADEAKIATDGYSRVARKVALTHSLLKRNDPGDRVNMDSTSLPIGSIKITGLVTLVEMAKVYLDKDKQFDSWKPRVAGELPMMPPEKEVTAAAAELVKLWDAMATLPVFEAITRGESINELREFPGKRFPDARGNLMLRPVGQLILAAVVRDLHRDPHGPQLSIDKIFTKLAAFDKKHGFDAADPKSPFYGITFEPLRQRMVTGEQERVLAIDLLKYLVNGASGNARDSLTERFRQARTFRDTADPTKSRYVSVAGKEVSSANDIELPPMIN